MLEIIKKFPLPALVVMIGLLALGVWQFNAAAGFGAAGYVAAMAVALGFTLVYWFAYGRGAGSAFRAALPLLAIGIPAAALHLAGVGGLTAAMLFYTLLPIAGVVVVLGELIHHPD